MLLYAETPRRRLVQLLGDVCVALWTIAWVEVGRGLHDAVARVAEVGRRVEAAGGGFAGTLDDVSRRVGRVPLAGGALRRPFEGAADAGRALEQAGTAATDSVLDLAVWLGLLVAALPIAWAVWVWLPGRVRWSREASAATRLRRDADDLALFALRAVANRPLLQLYRAEPDPAGALAAGRYDRLAAVELEALGLEISRRPRSRTPDRGR